MTIINPSSAFFLSSSAANTAAVAFTDARWPNNPFHMGEIALQQAVGAQESVMSYAPQFIRPYMPDQLREFFTDVPFLVAAARDETGAMWATLLESSKENKAPLLATSPTATTLHIQARPVAGDALETAFQSSGDGVATDLGLLGIQFETARRNRVNGRAVTADGGTSLVFSVDQSFGNCPQYIKPRSSPFRVVSTKEGHTAAAPSNSNNKRSNELTKTQIKWIESAETLFTATGYRGEGEDIRFGNDASHRGGPPGFVQVKDDNEIVWTEFKGNNHFNSLGNMLLDPRVGLAFPNFSTGGLLQVTGTAMVEMGILENGARKVRMQVTAVNELPAGSLPIRWKTDDASEKLEMQVADIVQESVDVKSFYLKPADVTKLLPSFRAGQHLPVELTMKDGEVIHRSYSLSAAPAWASRGYYRISVKQQEPSGKASSFLHQHVKVGDRLTVGKPAGSFTREKTITTCDKNGTTVLLSSGIGVTPVLSMLHEIAAEKNAKGKVIWIHGARNGKYQPLQEEVDSLLKEMTDGSMKRHIVYSRPEPQDTGHDFTGRITAEYVRQVVPDWNDASFYMCGPLSFLADLETGLGSLGVDSKNIHFETF